MHKKIKKLFRKTGRNLKNRLEQKKHTEASNLSMIGGSYGRELPERQKKTSKSSSHKSEISQDPPDPTDNVLVDKATERKIDDQSSGLNLPTPRSKPKKRQQQREIMPPRRRRTTTRPVTPPEQYYAASSFSADSDSDPGSRADSGSDSSITPPTTPLPQSKPKSNPNNPNSNKPNPSFLNSIHALVNKPLQPDAKKFQRKLTVTSQFATNQIAKKLASQFKSNQQTRLFRRYSTINEFNPDKPSPFAPLPASTLLKWLKTWRFKRDDEYTDEWVAPLPPWVTRETQAGMAELERENCERQLMLLEDLAMTEFLELAVSE